jgi:outer membrane protein assembly factor BamA
LNLKRRHSWGAHIYDQRDFFFVPDAGGDLDRQEEYQATGGEMFWQYPISRNYRFQTSLGVLDNSRAVPTSTGDFAEVSDTYGVIDLALVGDTTRWQSFGPFQGKRFNLGVRYWPQISGDSSGDVLEYRFEYRAYKKVTRRSTLAWRFRGIYNDGDSEITYGFGGINDLRGYDYREFIGSRIFQSNLEFRFPLAEELRFPILSIHEIRGFFFFDLLAPFFLDDFYYDSELGGFRGDLSGPIKFEAWDSENDRIQDLRGSYGVGFHFVFFGGLQFNWSFAETLSHTQFVPDLTNPGFLTKVKGDTDRRSDFYIIFDF